MDPCPCGSGIAYAGCCEPLHHGSPAPTAEALMRSRFSAFALGSSAPDSSAPDSSAPGHSSISALDAYLRSSWHPSTRPATLDRDDGIVWRRLQIVDTVGGGVDDATGIVEFRASFRSADGAAGLLHERSRFERVEGRWAYLDGELLS